VHKRLLAVASAATLAFSIAGLASCRKEEVRFTSMPVRTAAKPESRTAQTTVYVSFPVDLEAPRRQAEQAIPEKLHRVTEWIANAACGRRNTQVECQSAKVEGEITRAGAIEIGAEHGRVMLKVPLAYDLAVRGIGWAAFLTERKSGTLTVGVPFDVALSAGYAPDVTLREELIWSERNVPLLKGQLDLARLLQAKLKKPLATAADDLRAALTAQPLKEGSQRAWNVLQRPVELSASPALSLSSEPMRTWGAGFVQDGQRTSYRVAVSTRLTILEGRPIGQTGQKKLPDPTARPAGEASQTHIRLPMFVGFERIERALATAFPPQQRIETRADRFSGPVTVSVRNASVYPSQRQLAIELDLAVAAPTSWAGTTGKAWLVGKPVYRSEDQTIALEAVTFPVQTAKEAREGSGLRTAIQIGTEPFASRFATAAKLDVAREVREAVPLANSLFDQRIESEIQLQARFREASVLAVEPVVGGLSLTLDVAGEIVFRLDEGVKPVAATPLAAPPAAAPAQAPAARGEVKPAAGRR
jgi:hypothetical protein